MNVHQIPNIDDVINNLPSTATNHPKTVSTNSEAKLKLTRSRFR